MNHLAHSKNTSISRSLMAGLACGIIAALLNALFSYFYRKSTAFSGAEYFEPLLIFIGFPLFFLAAGLVFFEMADTMKRGGLLFSIICICLVLVAVIFWLGNLDQERQGLFLGMTLICGLLLSFLLPYLATHARIFMDKEEMQISED